MARAPTDIRAFFGGGGKPKVVEGKKRKEVETTPAKDKDMTDAEAPATVLSEAKPAPVKRRVIADSEDEQEFDTSLAPPAVKPAAGKAVAASPAKTKLETKKAAPAPEPKKAEPRAAAPQKAVPESTEPERKAPEVKAEPAKNTLAAPFFAAKKPAGAAGAAGAAGPSFAAEPAVVGYKAAAGEAGDSVMYGVLCDAFSKIEGISGRLEITSTITSLFEGVIAANPADLEATLFLACNKVAPPHANVILGIGEALISKCIVQTFGRTAAKVKELYDEEGDLGLVAEMSRASQKQLSFAAKPKPLKVVQVLGALRAIAEMEGNKVQDRKIGAIQRLLRDARGPEARYIIRALQGKLRIGLAETTVLVALAHAVVRSPPDFGPGGGAAVSAEEEARLLKEEPLEAETTLKHHHEGTGPYERKGGKARGGAGVPAEVLDAAVVLVKQAYAECSDHGMLAAALLAAPLHRVRSFCHLTPGTPVSPMLAKPTKSVDEVLKRLSGQRLTVEYKYDGERMQLHRLADGSVRIFSRSQEDTTQRWPELASSKFWGDEIFTTALAKGPGDGTFVLDAEVVAWDVAKKKLLPFQVLSTRKRKADESEEQAVRVIVQGFDLLYLHGESLLRQPLIRRRALMHAAFAEVEGRFTFAQGRDVDLRDAADKAKDDAAEAKDGAAGGIKGGVAGAEASYLEAALASAEDGEQLIAAFMGEAVEGACEGLMVKTLYGNSATYEPSVRSLNWLKLKKDYMDAYGGADSLDLVPIGAYNGKGKRTGVWGAYLLACYDPDSDEYQSVCKIGTGFSDDDLTSLATALEAEALPASAHRPRNYRLGESLEPDVYFKAAKVWEVRAADLSLSSTHKGGIGKPGIEAGRGIGLRFPRFLRSRDDKGPTNATSAEQIRDLYFDQQSVENATSAAPDEEEDFI